MYEVFCGEKETMEIIAERGATALNPKTMKFQLISKEAQYKVRKDETFYDDKGLPHVCATLLSNINLRTIVEEKGLII